MYSTITDLFNNPQKITYINESILSSIFNLNDFDILFLKLIWQSGFDDLLFFLDEPFIKKWFLPLENYKKELTDFYQEILFNNFKKNIDYRQISKLHPESKFIITGSCFKKICILCNDKCRNLFINLTRVAHMCLLNQMIQENKTQIKL